MSAERTYTRIFSDVSESDDRTSAWYHVASLLLERTVLCRNGDTYEWCDDEEHMQVEVVQTQAAAIRRAVAFHDQTVGQAFAAHKEKKHREKFNCACVKELYGTGRVSLPDAMGQCLGSCGRGLTADFQCETCGGSGMVPP